MRIEDHIWRLCSLALLNDIRAANSVPSMKQFLLHLFLLALNLVHAVLVLVEFRRCRPSPRAVGTPI